jgi:hypothetical protein
MPQNALRLAPDGGRAVLGARGLCETWLKEYYSEGKCKLGERGSSGAAQTQASPALRIVPNPADDMVRVSLGLPVAEGERLQVQFLDMNGRKVHAATLQAGNSELTVSVRGWQAGIYVAKAVRGNETFGQAFVVQHR